MQEEKVDTQQHQWVQIAKTKNRNEKLNNPAQNVMYGNWNNLIAQVI